MHGQRQLIMVNAAFLMYKGLVARKVAIWPFPFPSQPAMARLRRQARDGERDTQDFSRLANGLSILGRLIEGGNLERRLEALERITKR